ncbi:hypothetical protein BH23CHL5_BH23CHL5_25180 [soil metagenome]
MIKRTQSVSKSNSTAIKTSLILRYVNIALAVPTQNLWHLAHT